MRKILTRRAVARTTLVACLILLPARLMAGGGAHAVDDAGVETPGDCHLESWTSDLGRGQSLLNFGPACTPATVPTLELGATIQRLGQSGKGQWLVGPALKWAVRSGGGAPGERVGIALAGSVLVDARSGQLDSASLLVPFTLTPINRVSVNVNMGMGIVRGERAHLLYGAQILYSATDRITLMAETYGRHDRPIGVQGGVRWTFDRGRMDIDLLAARPPGRGQPAAFTLGFTVRR